MTILVLGINHKTASVALREKVAFSEEKRLLALDQIQQQELGQNAVILSTCNRTEIYLHNKNVSPQESEHLAEACINWFAEIHQLTKSELQNCLYLHQNHQAAQHIMRIGFAYFRRTANFRSGQTSLPNERRVLSAAANPSFK